MNMDAFFPAIHSTPSPAALMAEVLPGFNVGEIAACRYFIGGFNDTYQVETTTGTRYYLRIYRAFWRSLPDILYELDLLNHLARKGFPAARPLPYRDQGFTCELAAPEGPRYAVLFTEAPGKLVSYDEKPEEMAHHYGACVASLHNAAADFSSPHRRFQVDLELLIDAPLRNLAPFLAQRPDDWRYVQNFAARLRQRILDLPATRLEQGFCHGDLQGYHAHMDKDGQLTFFDFDCGGHGYRAYDLAVFRWCSRLKEQEAIWWEPYLRGYRSQRSLNELDLQAIPMFVGARYLWHMGVHTQNAYDWGCGWLDDDYFNNKINCLKAVEKDYFSTKAAVD
ncbi:MAG TPA: phosphotransferase [Anaerolineaceae bacterium]|nr:phosphotransferase [Anaerolineaceae bacterium]HPN53833.1 phosphotransferase [Anaerolineaceae bacterium]